MKTWIKLAIENGGRLTLFRSCGKYFARMDFDMALSIRVPSKTDIESALDALNNALQDDASDEINLYTPSSPIIG